VKFVEGLVVYAPPQDEDWDMLSKTNKMERENAKGEKSKYDKKKLASKAKFPLRTIEVNENMLKYCSEFFIEYDFFFMLSFVIVTLFFISQACKIIVPDYINTNLVFYLMQFLLMLAFLHLTK
jgi:hypothetical protein